MRKSFKVAYDHYVTTQHAPCYAPVNIYQHGHMPLLLTIAAFRPHDIDWRRAIESYDLLYHFWEAAKLLTLPLEAHKSHIPC